MLQTIKKWFKSNLISLGVIVGLVLYIMLRGATSHVANETSKVDTVLKPLYHYVDKSGDKHAQIPVQVLDKKEFKKATKEIKKEIKGSNKIESVSKFTHNTDTTLKNLVITDSVKNGDTILKFGYTDKYNNIQAEANLNTLKGQINLQISDEITYVSELEKHWFKRDVWKIDLKNKNTLSKIDKGMSFRQKESRPIIDFCVFTGYDFLNKSSNPLDHIVIAVGGGIHLFSIKTRK